MTLRLFQQMQHQNKTWSSNRSPTHSSYPKIICYIKDIIDHLQILVTMMMCLGKLKWSHFKINPWGFSFIHVVFEVCWRGFFNALSPLSPASAFLSFGWTNLCLRVLPDLKWTGMGRLLLIPLSFSEILPTQEMIFGHQSFSLSVLFLFAFYRNVWGSHMFVLFGLFFALIFDEIILSLVVQGDPDCVWWEVESRYRFMWFGFLFTSMFRYLPFWIKGTRQLSCKAPWVKFLWSMVLTCAVNASKMA